MGKSWYIGTYWGIPIKIHWTFGLLILYVIYNGVSNGLTPMQIVWFAGYVLLLFFCVILHEYGHALTARRYGIHTQDIILSPIGGIARLEKLPDNPWHELLVAIAGPLVNVVIASILGIVFYFALGFDQFMSSDDFSYIATIPGLLSYVLLSNIALFIFNLVPAFPMDGGRILRAFLSMKLGKKKATFWASVVGRIIAVGFIGVAIYFNAVTLGLIGVFIFFMARTENKNINIEESLKALKASEVVRADYITLYPDELMSHPMSIYQDGVEKTFIIKNRMDRVIGVLPDLFLDNAIKNNHGYAEVSQYVSNAMIEVSPETNLYDIYDRINKRGAAVALVKEEDRLVGIIDRPMMEKLIKSF